MKKYKQNKIVTTIATTETFHSGLSFLVIAYLIKLIKYSIIDITVNEIMPTPIPLVIEYESTITEIVKNVDVALIALLISNDFKLPCIINTPT